MKNGLLSKLTLAALVSVLAVVPVSMFAYHVWLQLEDLRELNLRSLFRAAEQTAELFSNAETVVESLDPEAKRFLKDFDEQQRFLENIDSNNQNGSNTYSIDLQSKSFYLHPSDGNYQLKTNELLKTLPANDEFDLLLLVYDSEVNNSRDNGAEVFDAGTVLAQHGNRSDLGVSFRSLITTHPSRCGSNPTSDKETLPLSFNSTISMPICVADVQFDLICQPVPPESEILREHALALCGVTESGQLFDKALTVTPLIVIVLLLTMFFGVLCWPMIKIVLMSDRERFKFNDLYFGLFGSWGAVMVYVILVLSLGTYLELEKSIKVSNEQLANTVDERLSEELSTLSSLLRHIDQEFKDSTKNVGISIKDFPAWQQESAIDFEMVFWVNPHDGKQLYKATVFEATTPYVNVGDRAYFQNARDDKLWHVDKDFWFVENIRSKTTTAVRTMLSGRSSRCVTEESKERQLPNNGCSNGGEHAVIAVQARLISVTDPVLSVGTGFAVVDGEGYAIFHSDSRRALRDNLFEEMSEGDRLAAAVLSRKQIHFESDYLGRPHRVFVHPLEQIPWSIVIFADRDPERVFIMETIGHAVILSFVFLLFALLGTAAYLCWAGRDGLPRWFWPAPEARKYHARWSILLLVLLVTLVSTVLRESADTRLAISFAVALLILFLMLFTSWSPVYCREQDAKVDRSSNANRNALFWYVMASALLWINVAVFPAWVFYQNALTASLEEFVKQENIVFGSDLESRNCAMQDYYRRFNQNCLDESLCDCYRGPDDCDRDIYRASLFNADEKKSPAKTAFKENQTSVVWGYLAHFKPLYGASSTQRRYLASTLNQEDVQVDSNKEAKFKDRFEFLDKGRLKYSPPHQICEVQGPVGELGSLESLPPKLQSSFFSIVVSSGAVGLLIIGVAVLLYVANKFYFFEVSRRFGNWVSEILHTDAGVIVCVGSTKRRDELKELARKDIEIEQANKLVWIELRSKDVQISPRLTPPLEGSGKWPWEEDWRKRSLLVFRSLDRKGLGYRAPLGFKVNWILAGEADAISCNESSIGEFWRRNMNRKISERWINRELACGIECIYSNLRVQLEDACKNNTSKREALHLLRETAHDFYEELWNQCSENERLVLVQLAEESIVNPKQASAVRSLLAHGLIVRDPALRVMNDSFAYWISDFHSEKDIEAWKQAAEGVTWRTWRRVFVIALLLIFAFLWFTQRHVVETGLAFLSVAGAAIPMLLKLVSNINLLGGQIDS